MATRRPRGRARTARPTGAPAARGRPTPRKSPPDNRQKQTETGGRDTRFQPGNSAGADTQFRPGASGNPAGRPRGSRAQLTDKFFDDVLAVWEVAGSGVLRHCAVRDTTAFLHIVAGLIPKKATFELENFPTTAELIAGYREPKP
jgi:Family of unknown function (DUF5681)